MIASKPERAKRGKYRNVGDFIQNGERVVGLKRRPNGRFYAAANPNKMFGTDPALAIHRFRQWEAEQGKQPKPVVPVKMPSSIDALDVAVGYAGKDEPRRRMIPSTWSPGEITTDVESLRWQERSRLRELLLTDPRQAAIEFDIPHLADYPAKPKAPKMTLEQLGETYVTTKRNKRTGKPICPQEQRESRKFWREFLNVVDVRHTRHVTEEHVQAYHDWVMRGFDAGRSAPWVGHRFGKVKTVLNFGVTKNIDRDECKRLLTCCSILEPPTASDPNPQPISPEDFHALLKVADVRQKAMLLTALNLCLHSSELVIATDELDLKKGVYVSSRTKTGVARCAVLWKATIRAIKAFRKAKPNPSEFLYLSRTGTPLTGKAVRRMFGSVREKAGLDDIAHEANDGTKRFCLEFNHIRDGAFTHATDSGIPWEHAKVLAGQRTSMADRYIKRNAEQLTGDCCKAIAKFYGIK